MSLRTTTYSTHAYIRHWFYSSTWLIYIHIPNRRMMNGPQIKQMVVECKRDCKRKKRRLFISIVTLVLLYGSLSGPKPSTYHYRRTVMEMIRRKVALRYVTIYHTESMEAVCVLSLTLSVELIAEENTVV